MQPRSEINVPNATIDQPSSVEILKNFLVDSYKEFLTTQVAPYQSDIGDIFIEQFDYNNFYSLMIEKLGNEYNISQYIVDLVDAFYDINNDLIKTNGIIKNYYSLTLESRKNHTDSTVEKYRKLNPEILSMPTGLEPILRIIPVLLATGNGQTNEFQEYSHELICADAMIQKNIANKILEITESIKDAAPWPKTLGINEIRTLQEKLSQHPSMIMCALQDIIARDYLQNGWKTCMANISEFTAYVDTLKSDYSEVICIHMDQIARSHLYDALLKESFKYRMQIIKDTLVSGDFATLFNKFTILNCENLDEKSASGDIDEDMSVFEDDVETALVEQTKITGAITSHLDFDIEDIDHDQDKSDYQSLIGSKILDYKRTHHKIQSRYEFSDDEIIAFNLSTINESNHEMQKIEKLLGDFIGQYSESFLIDIYKNLVFLRDKIYFQKANSNSESEKNRCSLILDVLNKMLLVNIELNTTGTCDITRLKMQSLPPELCDSPLKILNPIAMRIRLEQYEEYLENNLFVRAQLIDLLLCFFPSIKNMKIVSSADWIDTYIFIDRLQRKLFLKVDQEMNQKCLHLTIILDYLNETKKQIRQCNTWGEDETFEEFLQSFTVPLSITITAEEYKEYKLLTTDSARKEFMQNCVNLRGGTVNNVGAYIQFCTTEEIDRDTSEEFSSNKMFFVSDNIERVIEINGKESDKLAKFFGPNMLIDYMTLGKVRSLKNPEVFAKELHDYINVKKRPDCLCSKLGIDPTASDVYEKIEYLEAQCFKKIRSLNINHKFFGLTSVKAQLKIDLDKFHIAEFARQNKLRVILFKRPPKMQNIAQKAELIYPDDIYRLTSPSEQEMIEIEDLITARNAMLQSIKQYMTIRNISETVETQQVITAEKLTVADHDIGVLEYKESAMIDRIPDDFLASDKAMIEQHRLHISDTAAEKEAFHEIDDDYLCEEMQSNRPDFRTSF